MSAVKSVLMSLCALLIFLVFLACAPVETAQVLTSPDGATGLFFNLTPEGVPVYKVDFHADLVIADSPLEIELEQGGLFAGGVEVTSVERSEVDETFPVVAGVSARARNRYKEMVISLRRLAEPRRRAELIFRCYEDGVAFRYRFPKGKGDGELRVRDERTLFRLARPATAWALLLDGFTTNYETEYTPLTVAEIGAENLVGAPLTLTLKEGPAVAITEAGLTDYAGMYLRGVAGDSAALVSALSPLPDGGGLCVRAELPHCTPWRVIMIGKDPLDLIESNLILALNDPCAIEDPSWIEPGKVAWPWWSGRTVSGVDFEGGMNTATMKHYIDFAADMDLEYLLIDAQWYGDHRDAGADITTTIPEIDMPEIIAYAGERRVSVILWLNWQNLVRQMEEAFPLYQSWGVKGVKVDYMNRDDQEMVNIYHEIVARAAEHRLLVDFHGAYKPTGIRRTWPNLITREGVMGLEYAKWSERVTPEHNVTLPFTRMVAGPMDYTPGAFLNSTQADFVARGRAPMTMGTRCHQLAMFVVYESPLQMLCDFPGSYRRGEGAEFLKQVPSSWDSSLALSGEIGDYIVMARRRGPEWFIGAMTDWDARDLDIVLDFLDPGEYEVQIWADGPGAERYPQRVSVTRTRATSSDRLGAQLAPGGGYAAVIRPAK